MPGEYDDMEVGVDSLLQIPGDSEYLVEGLLAEAKWGAGGGRLCVLRAVERRASSFGIRCVDDSPSWLRVFGSGKREGSVGAISSD